MNMVSANTTDNQRTSRDDPEPATMSTSRGVLAGTGGCSPVEHVSIEPPNFSLSEGSGSSLRAIREVCCTDNLSEGASADLLRGLQRPAPTNVSEAAAGSRERRALSLFRVGLLNVNSMNQAKFKYITDFLKDSEYSSIMAITELTVKTNSELNNLLSNHSDFPTFVHEECPRVGLMVPNRLSEKVKVVDHYFSKQIRKGSEISAQLTVFELDLSTSKMYFCVVYLVPDAKSDIINTLFEKLRELKNKYKGLVSLGDFNLDQKVDLNLKKVELSLGDSMTQIVKKPTRRSSRTTPAGTKITETVIDLVFLDEKMMSKYDHYEIIEDSPSDHFLICTYFDIKVPKKYTEKVIFLDPTRRPPMKPETARLVNQLLLDKFLTDMPKIEKMSQSEIFEYITMTVNHYLNYHNPINSSKPVVKRIYNFVFSKKTQDLKKKFTRSRDELTKLKRNSNNDPSFLAYRTKLHNELRNKKNRSAQGDKEKYNSSRIIQDLDPKNSKSIFTVLKNIQNQRKPSNNSESVMMNGYSKVELANHMSNFFDQRAHLIPDTDIIENKEFIPFPMKNFNMLESIEIDSTNLSARELFAPKRGKKPTLATGPDSISHRHILDLMPSLEKVLDIALKKPIDSLGAVPETFVFAVYFMIFMK